MALGIHPMTTAYSQTSAQPVLVKAGIATYSDSVVLANVNGVLFFTANSGAYGTELWKSDGTASGTVMVKDVWPGGSSGTFYNQDFEAVNNLLFFIGNDGVNGYELWKSDGTAAETMMVKNVRTGAGNSTPSSLTNVNGMLFFTADDGTHGRELWKSDGTTAGTVLVKDVYPGASNGLSQADSDNFFTSCNGSLFFASNDGTHGVELWKSNGTEVGTVLVKDIAHSYMSQSASPEHLFCLNGTLFFDAWNGTESDLWKTDGTEANTVPIKQVLLPTGTSYAKPIAAMNGMLFFASDENPDGSTGKELWRSDGTVSGTVKVKDIWPGVAGSDPSELTPVNGTLFFTADDGALGVELWKSDGTEAGTVMVKETDPTDSSDHAANLTNANGVLFFSSTDGLHGDELWKSDGTEAGTVIVQDIRSGSSDSLPRKLTVVNDKLFFVAYGGVPATLGLWVLNVPVPPARLTLNNTTGQPGSYFVVTAQNFPANSTASVYVCGQLVGTINTDASGRVIFQIHTDASAQVGPYLITVKTSSPPRKI